MDYHGESMSAQKRSEASNRVRVYREQLGLTQLDLCRSALVSQATLKRLEAGDAPVSRVMKFRVLNALNKTRTTQNRQPLGFGDVFPNDPDPFQV